MMRRREQISENEISVAYLSDCFRYCPESGSLHWLPRPRSHFVSEKGFKSFQTQCAMKLAGRRRPTGSLVVFMTIGGRRATLHAHRIAWALTHGAWPTDQIDHIDGDPSNNRISNLRDVSNAENGRNQKLRVDSSTGVTGVYWHKASGKWHASIYAGERQIHLGLHENKADAVAARKAAEKLYGFHENHGRAA
jgi:hypothetical protein